MHLFHTLGELRQFLNQHAAKRIALVPTMGNLHAGHCQLVTAAKRHAELVVVSIFVNPLQFGAHEDFGSYPRTLSADCEQLAKVGADAVFAPSVNEMYPDADAQGLHQTVTIQPPPLADILCGASRPGHFVGVCTVVAKLFHMVNPQVAVFGKKDYQQWMVIRQMVRQLHFAIEIIACETQREASGLAMSSRNGYLTEAQKTQAAQLYAQLGGIRQALLTGAREYAALCHQATTQLTQHGWQVDYMEIRHPADLRPSERNDQTWVVLAAAKLGQTRLIDNIEVALPAAQLE